MRSDDSPSVPSCPRPCPRSGTWPATCGGPGTRRPRTSSPRSTPSCGSRPGATRCGCSARSSRPGSSELAADAGLPATGSARPSADLDAYLTGERWYQPQGRRRGPTRDRLLLPGVRHHRGAAAVLRRPRHPRRRPPQGRQRPRRPDRRRRPALPRTATSSSRSRARAGSRRATRCSTPTGCRSRCCARPTAPARTISIALPDGPPTCSPGSGWPASAGCRCCCSTPTSRATPSTTVDVTDRLYGGNSEHRLRQELLLGVGGVRALRAFTPASPAHPAPEVFHTNEGHAGFLGLERIRELTVEEGGPRLDFDTALEVGRASTVFTTHTPVPAGIDRFPRDAGRAVLRRGRRRPPAYRSSGCSRSAPRTTTAATRRSSTWR